MNKKVIAIVLVVLVVGGGVFAYFAGKSAGRASTGVTGNSVRANGISGERKVTGDLFRGTISNMAVQPGTFRGIGVYDRSCMMGQDGLTSCDAGIQSKEYGLLNFKYRHNMATQPCIGPNDQVEVRILDSNGNAEVQKVV